MNAQDTKQERDAPAATTFGERILVRAPSGNDAVSIAEMLEQQGYGVVPIHELESLAGEWAKGAGVLVIATEALNDADCCARLRHLLDAQPTWSEIPVVVLGGGAEDETPRIEELLGQRAQLLVLERPMGVATLLSAVESALRSRRRQYEVRRLLDELEASARSIARAHEQADRTKDEFLATLAHELRSPMAAIQGWIQMLQLGELTPTEAANALAMIETSTRVQAHIIEDLMDVSRILAGKIMIEPSVVDLSPVVTSCVATFRSAAAVNGIDLTVTLAAESLFVEGDSARLQQVGWNLLSNAIKFTPRGGSIRVSLGQEQGNAVLRVRDNGKGILPELLPNVFERYRQEEGAGGKAHHGLGLGLAIVRHLVEAHGGTIVATSEGRGKGAEFVVTLPLCQPR
jgi:signal transduction histidine kinase